MADDARETELRDDSRLLDDSCEEEVFVVLDDMAEERGEKSDVVGEEDTQRRWFAPMAGIGEAEGEGDSVRNVGCSEYCEVSILVVFVFYTFGEEYVNVVVVPSHSPQLAALFFYLPNQNIYTD